ncbi:MAG: FAD:protein FMN transferase, partial [Bacteroidota bacterium]
KKITGETMGTYYAVTFVEGEERLDATQLKKQIDSTLIALNAEVSNWEKNSTVVRFNESEQGISVVDAKHFLANFKLAQSASLATGGAFEPTILPLTDYWGFGSGRERIEAGVDTAEVMRRLALVDINKIELVGDTFLRKAEPGVRLDLGGSAKGYGVDLIANFLQAKGIEHLFVEIGGEVFASGMRGDRPWRAGVNLPEEGAAFNAIAETMSVNNQGVATSGNYRNYYKVGAETYSHTLNPKTGFPERNSLLSASVLAPNCATADAFATACMVLGPDAALTLIESRPELEAYFLVRTENGEMEPRFSSGLGL